MLSHMFLAAVLLLTMPTVPPISTEAVVTLARPDGGKAQYRMEESPIMEPKLAARFPEIRTYALSGKDGGVGCLTLTPNGVSGLLLERGRSFVLTSLPSGEIVMRDEAELLEASPLFCGADGEPIALPAMSPDASHRKLASGATLRTYRLAVATTGEFYAARGGTDGNVLAAIVTDMNKVNLRYGLELAIGFVLINATTDLFYTNAGTDPYTDGTPCTMRGEAQVDIPAVIDPADFDIGHVFGAVPAGGCAGGANVCTANKANGASTFQTDGSHPSGHEDYGGYRLIMHEMGHQFGAGHTWNANNAGNCTVAQYSLGTAVEPSSGTTIMSYSGTCSPQDIRPGVADAYFHTFTYDEIITFSTVGAGDSCALAAASGNSAPTVNAGPDYTIPRGTPFTLSGSGSDPDGHALTFTWEQVDIAAAPLSANVDDGVGPLFRSFPSAAAGNVRTFPQMPVVLGDLPLQIGETLPTTNRTMTFRLVARDDQAIGGVEYDTTIVTTNGSPFTVTAPGPTSVLQAGCAATVDWSVGSAASYATEARILFSTDGGQTFDQELGVVPIDSAPVEVTLPCIPTTQARIKVEAVGSIFFDVNPGNFDVVDERPSIDLSASPALVTNGCAGEVAFEVMITDDCGIAAADVSVTASLAGGSATVGVADFTAVPQGGMAVLITGTVPVSNLVGCPAAVEIAVEAIDACGFAAQAQIVALVLDEVPPTLLGVPPDATHECDAVPGAPLVSAVDNCGPAPALSFDETLIPGACPGNYQLIREWSATDLCGNDTIVQQVVTVQDTTPPVVTPSEDDVACLWPPNHQMRCFGAEAFAPVVSDACSEPVTWRFVDCASDQAADGNGDGNTAPDCVVADDGLTFCVRAERSGSESAGRRYAVSIEAEDACGNVSAPVIIGNVHVPRSSSKNQGCGGGN